MSLKDIHWLEKVDRKVGEFKFRREITQMKKNLDEDNRVSEFSGLPPWIGTPENPLHKDEMFNELSNVLLAIGMPQTDIDYLTKVYKFADQKFAESDDPLRKNGFDETVTHSLWLCLLLVQNNISDKTTLAATLIHDVYEDTEVSYEEIVELTDTDTANLVEGLKKIKTTILLGETFDELEDRDQLSTELKLLETFENDPRVLIIKSVDIIHNQLTSDTLPERDRLRKAGIALKFFGPLTRDFGLTYFADMIEDTALRSQKPKQFERIRNIRDNLSEKYKGPFSNIVSKWQDLGSQGGEPLSTSSVSIDIPTVCQIYQKTRTSVDKNIKHDYTLPKINITCANKQDILRWVEFLNSQFNITPENSDELVLWDNPIIINVGAEVLGITFEAKGSVQISLGLADMAIKPSDIFTGIVDPNTKAGEISKAKFEKIIVALRDSLDDPGTAINEIIQGSQKGRIVVFDRQGNRHYVRKDSSALDVAYLLGSNLGNDSDAVLVGGKPMPLDIPIEAGMKFEFITPTANTFIQPNRYEMVKTEKAISDIRKKLALQIDGIISPDIQTDDKTLISETAKQIAKGKYVSDLKNLLVGGANSENTSPDIKRFVEVARTRGVRILKEMYRSQRNKNLDSYIADALQSGNGLRKRVGDIEDVLINIGLTAIPLNSNEFMDAWKKDKPEKYETVQIARQVVRKIIEFRDSCFVLDFTIEDTPGILQFLGETAASSEVSADVQIETKPDNSQPGRNARIEIVFMKGDQLSVDMLTASLIKKYGTQVSILFSGQEKDRR